jgi:predicted dehydrogenase
MIDLPNHWYHRLPGGVIGETGPHFAYISGEFTAGIVDADIDARSHLLLSWAPFDEFAITLKGEKCSCSGLLTYSSNSFAAMVDIIGTEAILSIDLERMLTVRRELRELEYVAIAMSSLSDIYQTCKGLASNVIRTLAGSQMIGTEKIIFEYLECLKKDTQPPVTGEDGRRVVRTMEMIVKRYEEKYGARSKGQKPQ